MKHASAPLADEAQRWQSITTHRHAFVWASAGTGKTHTLTQRALYLLLNAPFLPLGNQGRAGFLPQIQNLYQAASRKERLASARSVVRSVVLTTFTRKAAAEMQNRLYGYLESVAFAGSMARLEALYPRDHLFLKIIEAVLDRLTGTSEDLPLFGVSPERSFEMLGAGAQCLAEVASELQISTIHSLAAAILRRHPLQSGLPPSARFAREDEDDLEGVDDQIVDAWWQRKVLIDPGLQTQLRELLRVISVRQIRDWLKLCVQSRWLATEVAGFIAPGYDPRQDLLRATRGLLDRWSRGKGSKLDRTRDRLEKLVLGIEAGTSGGWSTLCRFMEQQRSYLFADRSSTPKLLREAIAGLDPQHAGYFRSWTSFCGPAAQVAVSTEFAPTWEIWGSFLQSFVDWANRAAVQQLGLVTFDEMIHRAVQLLEQNPGLRRQEQSRLRALLVDEFQDTDPDQLRLFTALLRREPDTDHEVLGFFVGDPKQSIYRFRGADVDSIEDFRTRYQEHTGCQLGHRDFRLQTSFRSTPEIIQFVNRFFAKELPLTSSGDLLLASRPPSQALPEWIQLSPPEAGSTLSKIRAQAAAETLRLIRTHLENSSGHAPQYRDILVLVKDWLEVEALLPLLQKAGIPTVSSGAKTFHRHPEVLDVLNLLIAMHHPGDALAVASLLRSPILLLSDTQIHRLLQQLPTRDVFHSRDPLPEDLPPEVRLTIERLRQLVERRTQIPLAEWLQELQQVVPRVLYREPGDGEGRPTVRIDRVFRSFQQQLETASLPTLVWLLQQRTRASDRGRWQAGPGEDVSLADESVNAVRVMTIHKAKGLEGRFVIVYGWASILFELERPRGGGPPPACIQLRSKDGPLLQGFSLRWGSLQLISSGYPEVLRLDGESQQAETRRLAYVAATRAREKMVLLFPQLPHSRLPDALRELVGGGAQQTSGEDGGRVCNGNLIYRHAVPLSTPGSASRVTSPRWYTDRYLQFWEERYSGLRTVAPPLVARPSQAGHAGEDEWLEKEHRPRSGRGDLQRIAGGLIHLYLEHHLLESDYQAEKLARLLFETVPASSRREVGALTEDVLSAFYGGDLKDHRGIPFRERIDRGRVRSREFPVYLFQDGRSWHGIIDLVLEEGEIIRGVDYKTGSLRRPLPESYTLQETIYGAALQKIFPDRQVGFEFWWLGG